MLSSEKCIRIIQETSQKKLFFLIEHLAYEVHSALKKQLSIGLEIIIRVEREGISFTYSPKKEGEEKKPGKIWDEE